MPVISFASPKGGVGKTTAALLLSTELAQKGIPVTVLDTDPERWISGWGELPDKPELLKIMNDVTEANIIDVIETAQAETPFVVIDLEGTANMLVAYAIAHSDLVIVPMQGSDMDARAAGKAINLIKQQERAFRKDIPYRIVLTRTSAAIKPRSLRNIQEQLARAKIEIFETQIMERDAFRSLFSFGGTLESQNKKEVSGLDKALVNARAFAGETMAYLKSRADDNKKDNAEIVEVA
jgi:chromosome partitioning protein